MIIKSIFPTPVAFFDIGELDFRQKHIIDNLQWDNNTGNKISTNRNILDTVDFVSLKTKFYQSLLEYFKKVYDPTCEIKPYITQSWVNYTEKGMFHHKHTHANSFLSGVYYVKADLNKDKIMFHNEEYSLLKFPSNSYNEYNSELWWFPVSSGTLIIFPSSLMHGVPTVNDDLRISIGFNTFLEGLIGDDFTSFNLKLKVTNLS